MSEIELFIIDEIKSKKDFTFIYQLHNNYLFDINKFEKLIDYSNILIDYYNCNGKSDTYIEIVKGLMILFEHTLFLLYCHMNPKDTYVINNFDNQLNDNITKYYMDIRNITNKLIW